MEITGAQIRAGRALLNISAAALARMANVSLPTVLRFEAAEKPHTATTKSALVAALERAGIEFAAGGVRPRETGLRRGETNG